MLSVFDIDHDKIGWLHLKRLNVWIAKQVDEKCGCYGVNLKNWDRLQPQDDWNKTLVVLNWQIIDLFTLNSQLQKKPLNSFLKGKMAGV